MNNVVLSGQPDQISIRAHGVNFKSSLKEKVSTDHTGITLGSLISSIASKHGLSPKVAKDLSGLVINHITQTNESDMHFLTRLAEMYGAIAKPASGNLIFAEQGSAQSISGGPLGATIIDISQAIAWSYSVSKREDYSKVKSEYVDLNRLKLKKSKLEKEIQHTFCNRLMAIKMKLKQLLKRHFLELKRISESCNYRQLEILI